MYSSIRAGLDRRFFVKRSMYCVLQFTRLPLHRCIVTTKHMAHRGLLSPDFPTSITRPGCEMMDSGGMTKILRWEQQLIRHSMRT